MKTNTVAAVAGLALAAVGAVVLRDDCEATVIDCRGPGLMHVRAKVCGGVAKIHPALAAERPREINHCTLRDGGAVVVPRIDGGTK